MQTYKRPSVLTGRSPAPPTLCRLEKCADQQTAWRLHAVLVEQFIASFKTAPEELVLDFDATDNPLHGQQEGRFFHGYYDCYCYLPLYVFCGQQLLVTGAVSMPRLQSFEIRPGMAPEGP